MVRTYTDGDTLCEVSVPQYTMDTYEMLNVRVLAQLCSCDFFLSFFFKQKIASNCQEYFMHVKNDC